MKWCKPKKLRRKGSKRSGQVWQVTIGRGFRIPLPGVPYKVGTRMFWEVCKERNGVIGTVSPKGTLRQGRFLSSRIRSMNPRRFKVQICR